MLFIPIESLHLKQIEVIRAGNGLLKTQERRNVVLNTYVVELFDICAILGLIYAIY